MQFAFGTTPILMLGASMLRFRRIASRKILLARFRSTAVPRRFAVSMAYRKVSDGCQNKLQYSPGNLEPLVSKSSISARVFRVRDRGSLFLAGNFDHQSFPAFGTTAGQDFSAIFGRHAGSETMVIELLAVRGLECSFHSLLPLYEPGNIQDRRGKSRETAGCGGLYISAWSRFRVVGAWPAK